ncbi:MAG: single-stranded-DNA-specific exonuclease RecJ [Opitutales bacterium]|nr:single-stranded-DNA-specific exonuclease RecJ [Opitutales bacterium]
MRWIHAPFDAGRAREFARATGLCRPAAEVLARHSVGSLEEAEAFLDPRLASLTDPFSLTGMDAAVDRLLAAMHKGEDILVFGDYDVDGVTSTVILVDFLNRYGIYPRYIVPRRLEEGYGLSLIALQRALEEAVPSLVVAVDCGTGSNEPIAWLRQQGIDVVILDHHTPKEGSPLPTDCVIVNPHVHDGEGNPWFDLCAVGIVFKFVHALLKRLREADDPLAYKIRLKDYLDLVALGTIADLVPLTGENRIFVSHGLRLLRETHRTGLCALFEVGGVRLGDEITPFDVSFRIGPRINASGRLADAREPIEMLLSEDWRKCRATAQELDGFNRDRQRIERAIAEEAVAMIEDRFSDAPGFILYGPDWHPGVVGIVASRIVNKFNRPALVLGEESGQAKGSGRSVEGIDLVQILNPCADILESWGGHPMAVGLTVDPAFIPELRERFCAGLVEVTQGVMPEPTLTVSTVIGLEDLTETLLADLSRLAPFGQGNPEPVFHLRGAMIENAQPLGQTGLHSRFFVRTPALGNVSGLAWGWAPEKLPSSGSPVDLAVRFSWNSWQGRKSPRLTLLDWRRVG